MFSTFPVCLYSLTNIIEYDIAIKQKQNISSADMTESAIDSACVRKSTPVCKITAFKMLNYTIAAIA